MMDPISPVNVGLNVNVSADVTPLMNKGIGKFFRFLMPQAWFERYQRREIQTAQLEVVCKDIKRGRALYDPSTDTVSYMIDAHEQKRRKNLSSICCKTINFLGKIPDDSVSDLPLDEDFRMRWQGDALEICDEDKQNTWAQLMISEIKQPGKISLRTMSLLKNMSKKEAEIFNKILPIVAYFDGKMFFPSSAKLCEEYGITYEDAMQLDETGLINIHSGITNSKRLSKNEEALVKGKDYYISIRNSQS